VNPAEHPVPGGEPVSSVDYAWLRMDEPANLMTVNGVLVFDQPLTREELAAVLEERLLAIPRFRDRLVAPRGPNGKRRRGRPRWEPDPTFDLRHHLVVSDLPPPGDEAALRDAVSALLGEPLDYDRPLWRFHLFQGYRGGSAVMPTLHHCLGDGIALMMVLFSLTDVGEGEGRSENPFRTLFAGAGRDLGKVRELAERLMPDGMRLMLHPADALASLGRFLKGAAVTGALGRLALRSSDPKTALKGPLTPGKRVAWSRPIPLAEVKAVGQALGGTVNDVLVTAVAGGLRRYLDGREGAATRKRAGRLAFRAAVPVNVRPLEQMDRLGNQFGLVFLSLPVGILDPVERLAAVRRRMRALRASAEPLVVFGLLRVLGAGPAVFQRAAVRLLAAKTTVVLTNVPGPREVLYMAGKAIRQLFFWVPQAGRVGIGISLLSYAGEVHVGVGTDAGLVPDPERIVETFHQEMEGLKRAAAAAR
jgi:WS/DGAT/MGAT family acyltransferase